MPTITEERRRKIAEIENKIEDDLNWIQKTRLELEEMLKLVEGVQAPALDQMSRSASSSARMRGMTDAVGIGETARKFQQTIENLREVIGTRERELNELRAEKQALESFEQGA